MGNRLKKIQVSMSELYGYGLSHLIQNDHGTLLIMMQERLFCGSLFDPVPETYLFCCALGEAQLRRQGLNVQAI